MEKDRREAGQGKGKEEKGVGKRGEKGKRGTEGEVKREEGREREVTPQELAHTPCRSSSAIYPQKS